MLIKLILKGYLPLVKKGTNKIEIKTEHMFNILLGRNGFGKTSILKELSPLPAENSDYEDGGEKEIIYKINNDLFILKSITGKKGKHSFIRNGKELNEGGTITVQKDLVRSYFKITNEIRAIISGLDVADLMTSLTPQRRKNFFMEINPNDTSYALKIFEKAKRAYNNTKGALKNQKERLVIETKRQTELSDMDGEKLQKEIEELDKQIKDALLIHGSLIGIDKPNILPIKNKMENIISQLLSNDDIIKNKLFLKTKWQVNEYIERKNRLIENDKIKLKLLNEKIVSINDKINSFKIEDGMDLKSYEIKIKDIEKHLKEIELEKESLLKVINKEEFFKNNDKWKDSDFINSILDLINMIVNVEKTTDLNLTAQEYSLVGKQVNELESKINILNNELKTNLHTIEHFNKADNTKCPKCDHNFKVGFETLNIDQLKELNSKLINNLDNLKLELKKKKDFLEANEGWFETMMALIRFVRRSKAGEYIFSIIKHYNIGKASTDVLVNVLKAINNLNELDKESKDLNSKLITLNGQYELLNESDITSLLALAEETYKQINECQDRIRDNRNEIERENKSLTIFLNDEALRDELILLREQLDAELVKSGKFIIKERVEEIINELTPAKDLLVTNLIRAKSLNSVIESIQENIKDLEKREYHFKAIMDSLSPSKGWIGHLTSDFLNAVIANVNAKIEPIWTGRLKLLSCNFEQTDETVDLDYKFPMLTGDQDTPVPDIKYGSGGEREIINFKFREVLLGYLGERSGLGLIMDEVGVMLDELHRANFFNSISEAMRLDTLPQTFMVSHYVNQYSMFDNDVNVIALNIEGLKVPMEYNENVVVN